MIKIQKVLLVVLILMIPKLQACNTFEYSSNNITKAKVSIPKEWAKDTLEISHLLNRIPSNLKDDFIDTIYDFAQDRCIDWRLVILIMYNESGLNPKISVRSFSGLIMFGNDARNNLKITNDSLLKMNHVQQAKLAIEHWESIEKWGPKYKIKDFLSLQLATFNPGWIPMKGDPYPSDSLVKKQNYPLLDTSGEITRNSLLDFYKNKIKNNKELKFYHEKIK